MVADHRVWNGIAAGERGLTPVVNPIMQHEPVNRRWERGPPLSISDSPHLISRLSRTTFPLPRVPWVCTVHRFTAADRLVFSCGRSGRRPTAAPFPCRLVALHAGTDGTLRRTSSPSSRRTSSPSSRRTPHHPLVAPPHPPLVAPPRPACSSHREGGEGCCGAPARCDAMWRLRERGEPPASRPSGQAPRRGPPAERRPSPTRSSVDRRHSHRTLLWRLLRLMDNVVASVALLLHRRVHPTPLVPVVHRIPAAAALSSTRRHPRR